MAKQLPDSKRDGGGKKRAASKKAKTPEFIERLDQIARSHPPARLMVDLARDAGLEVYRKQGRQIRRLSHELVKVKKKRGALHTRLVEMLHRISTLPVVLPRPASRPIVAHDSLLATFRRLQSQDFPAMAQLLHDVIGRADALAYQRFLVEEILIKGSWILVEHLIRHANESRTEEEDAEFADQLRDHIAGSVGQGLARKVGYQMTAEIGQQRDVLIKGTIAFLGGLLTATPPGRLVIPVLDSPFDPQRHKPIGGCPDAGELRVTATMFPGYVVFADAERVEEKALVYTEEME